jgi:hypothetical protein
MVPAGARPSRPSSAWRQGGRGKVANRRRPWNDSQGLPSSHGAAIRLQRVWPMAATMAPSPYGRARLRQTRVSSSNSRLSSSHQTRAQRQRLRGVGVTSTQLAEGAALLAAVQAQLSGGGDAHGASFTAAPSPVRRRKPPQAPPVDAGPIQAESWPFFAPVQAAPELPSDGAAARTSPPRAAEDLRAGVPGVGADGWPTGFGTEPLGNRAAGKTRRRPKSVSGTRPSSFGGSNFGRPSTSEGARTFAQPTSEGAAARPFGRPSTSEGCRTFGRPEKTRARGSSPGRPVTVEGTRPHGRASAGGWSGHGDGASWFRAEQETAKREQAATKEAEERWRAHFEAQSPAPRQDPWERRQARRRASEERSEQRASQFRAQKAREKEATRQQSAMVGPQD